jgi:hypothetical protein
MTDTLPPHGGPDPEHARPLDRAQAIARITLFVALARKIREGK